MIILSVGHMKVDGATCSESLGACGPRGSCEQRCKAKWSGGEESCKLGLCTCNYTCGLKPSSGPQERKCKSGLGVCNNQCDNACCNRKCASRFYQGIGDCSNVGGSPYRLCTCYYDGLCP
jgi:hypothetical protein